MGKRKIFFCSGPVVGSLGTCCTLDLETYDFDENLLVYITSLINVKRFVLLVLMLGPPGRSDFGSPGRIVENGKVLVLLGWPNYPLVIMSGPRKRKL